MPLNTTMDYSPVDRRSYDSPERFREEDSPAGYQMRASWGAPPEPYNPYDHRAVPPEPQELEGSAGGLRVANRTNSNESDDWEQEALRELNLRR